MSAVRRDHVHVHRPLGASRSYAITVAGHLDDHWSDWLAGHGLVRNDDGSTTITVVDVDQARLHGVLAGIRDLGVGMLGLRLLEGGPSPSSPRPTLARPLRSERLTLRPATERDAEVTWAYRRLDPVSAWLSGTSVGFAEYRSMFVEPSRLAATVMVEVLEGPGSRVIGDLMLRVEDAWAQAEVAERAQRVQAELGWVLDPAHVGMGYATEAVRELLRHGFDELGLHRVVATCFLDDESSWRLMERVGMRREAHAVRDSLHRSGRWLDSVSYAVLREDWHDLTASAHHGSQATR